jgi:hypothetical protein
MQCCDLMALAQLCWSGTKSKLQPRCYVHTSPKAWQERLHPQSGCPWRPWRQVLSVAERADGRTVMDQINKVAHNLVPA